RRHTRFSRDWSSDVCSSDLSGGSLDLAHLTDELGFSAAVIRGLVDKELVTLHDEPLVRDPFAAMEPPPPSSHTPTPAQAEAIRRLAAASRAAVSTGVRFETGADESDPDAGSIT